VDDDHISDYETWDDEQDEQNPYSLTDNVKDEPWSPPYISSPDLSTDNLQMRHDAPSIIYSESEENEDEKSPLNKIESSLLYELKSIESVSVVITAYDMSEVRALLGIETATTASQQKKYAARLDTSVLEIPSYMVPQVASLKSVINIQSYRLYDPPISPEDIEGLGYDSGMDPAMWNAVKYHGADGAWDLGFNGSGVNVAVIDTGVDFGNPDLNGTQARDENPTSPYYGWPLAFDSRSMQSYLSSEGQGFTGSGGENNWFSDTNTTDADSNANGTLDTSGFNVSGIVSQSGIYHLGKQPDTRLRNIYGDYVDILVVDENLPGVYDTVYVNLDNDNNFTDEKPARKWDEVSSHDLGGDGIPDRSGGMIYFIADGINPVPYSDVIAAENGYTLPIPSNGTLVCFMINDNTESGGSHGTKCASAIAGQGVIASGRVKGTAPEAKIIAIGNFYGGGNELDSYYFAVEGYDGIPGTGDEAHIVSCSFGDSNVIHGGWDYTSRFVDNLTTFYAPGVTFSIASGNGGYGYGTVVSPGSSMGVVTVGAALNKRETEVVYWSNRGPNAVGQVDPDVVSVGVAAYGDIPLNQLGTPNGNNAYQTWSGTSLATPVTAGIIALIYDAYFQAHGEFPTSELSREILMSTADNLNYDPLVQGAGFSNATRATKVASDTSGLLLSPTFWTAGDYRGTDYDGFAHILHPGDSDNLTIEVSNQNQNSTMDVYISDYILTRSETHTTVILSNKSELDSNNNRPDFLIPLYDSINNISYIPNDTALLKVWGFMPYDQFDKDLNYNQENRFTMTVYNWRDNNGNGSYWNDTNGDGVSQIGEIEWSELSSICSSSITATTQEARMHDPLTRVTDGLVVGVFHRPGGAAVQFTDIYIQSQCYNRTDWDWLSQNTSYITVGPNSTGTFTASISVPQSTPIGIYEGMIVINDTRNETAMPVIVNVASNSEKFTFGGNLLSTDLYANDQVFGGFRWGWRYEGGDWRFYFTDIPDSYAIKPGTKLVADLKWDNYPTDIDVFLLGGIKDTFSSEIPDRFGPYTLDISGSSADHYIWAGKFRFNTTTGTTHEIIAADLSPGLNEIILHNVLYSGMWFSENVTGEIGTINITPYPWDVGFIEDVGNLTGEQQFTVLSSFNMSEINVKAYGVYPPMEYPNQLVYQNDPSDKTTSNWSREFNVSGADYIRVNISSETAMDTDLFLLRDINTNGIPDWGSEQVASSTSPDQEEEILLNNPADGKYWVFVHGWSIPASPSLFDCYIEVVYGNDINVTDVPTGPFSAGDPVYFNASYILPPIAGEHRGVIRVGVTNLSSSITIPFFAELESEPPIISNTMPSNGLWVNSSQPAISSQYEDTGSGINTSRVYIYIDGTNHTDNATIDLDSISIIPPINLSEGNHIVNLTVFDMFGNQNSISWQFFVDTINPIAVAGDNQTAFEDEILTFNGSLSSDENELYNLTWDFGDGYFGYGTKSTHTYTQALTYNVTLIVRDVANNTVSDTLFVFVYNVAPNADSGIDQNLNEGDLGYFDADNSYDTPSDMPTLNYTWYFDGGIVLYGMNVSYSFSDDGMYTVTLVVEDDDGDTDSDTLNVTVNNVAPTADANGPYLGSEGSPVFFSGSAWDPGNDTFTYSWDFDDSDGLTYTDATGFSPNWTWFDEFSGTVYLRVQDDDGGLGFDTADVTIDNVPPQADTGGPYFGSEGSVIDIFGSVSDPGQDVFTFEWDLDFDGEYDDATGANPSWIWYDDGVYNISLRVSDGDSGSDVDFNTVTIGNIPPTAFSGGPYFGIEGTQVMISGSVQDPGNDTFLFEWDFDDSDGITYEDAQGPNATWTWPDDFSGTIYLRVTDDDGDFGYDFASITISNSQPEAEAAGPYSIPEGGDLILSGSATDLGADTFSYEWDLDGDGEYDEAVGSNPAWTWYDDGIYLIRLKVTDDDGDFSFDTSSVKVVNVAPSADAGVIYYGDEGSPMDLNSNVTDPGIYDTFTYRWDFGDGKQSMQKNPSHVYDDDGIYTVTFTVTDDNNGVGSDSVIAIIYNTPPEIEEIASKISAWEDTPFMLKINATDAIGDTITFHDNSPLFEINDVSGLIQFTPTNDDVGEYYVTITASDEDGGSSIIVFLLTINNKNDPPVLDYIGPLSAYEDSHFAFTVMASDIDFDDVLTFSDNTDLFEIDSQTGLISFTPANDEVGDRFVFITVTDSDGAQDQERVLFTVHDTNDPPVMDDIPIQYAVVGERYTFTIQAFDVDDSQLTFSDDSTIFNIDPESGMISFVPQKGDEGIHTIKIFAVDERDGQDEKTMTLEIQGIPDSAEDGFDGLIWIPLVILIVAIAIILLFLLTRRKEDEEEKDVKPTVDENEKGQEPPPPPDLKKENQPSDPNLNPPPPPPLPEPIEEVAPKEPKNEHPSPPESMD
jgi:PKD repeat protein